MESEHKIKIEETDEGYNLSCEGEGCEFTYRATKALPTKLHGEKWAEREPQVFAQAVAERHLTAMGIWPYTDHGKPEKHNDDGTVTIMAEWPYNKD